MSHHLPVDRATRARKGKAFLAAGVISGLGATMTLAAWSDAARVSASFRTDTFNVQGLSNSVEGWADHSTTDSPAVFQPVMGSISPGTTRSYALFGLRMAPGSTVGATVTIPAGTKMTPSTQAILISMRVVRVQDENCSATSFAPNSTYVVGSAAPSFGSMLSGPRAEAATVTLLPSDDAESPGRAAYLCYEFSLPQSVPPAGLSNGSVASVLWAFSAKSM